MAGSQVDIAVTGAVAALALGDAATGAPAPVTIVLGIALFAAPGYLLAQLLLGPGIGAMERVAVGGGLAFAVPVLGGMLLYAADVPLHRVGWLILFCMVTLAADVSLLLRRRRPGASACPAAPKLRLPPRHAAVLGAAVLVAACGVVLARAAVALQHTPAFTELWLSPRAGHAPLASLGVSNQQGITTRYRLTLLRDGRVHETWTFRLSSGKAWQRAVRYDPRYPLAANLYRFPDLSHPYRHVTTPGQETWKP
jgi:hypothetical protein